MTLSAGDYVTATVTRIDAPGQVGLDDLLAYGNTSEFAQNVAMAAVNVAPTDLYAASVTEGGVSLNNDGGNDVYFVADDGAGLLGGLTTLTIEASFSVDTPAADNTVLLSYANGANDEELGLFLKNDGSIWFCAHSPGAPYQSTASQYPQLFDGDVHHVGVSWDATNGAVAFYIDGQPAESFTGYQTGQVITGAGELVIGQDQDSVLGGFNPIDVFSGTLYDVRIFDDVRSPAEVASGYGQTLPSSEPGMIANWTFNDMSGSGVVTDNVSGNNLTEQHVGVGGGFTTSTPNLTLEAEENAADGTIVGTLATIDPNTGDTFTYTLLNDAGGRFDIALGTGVITVQNGSLLNFESAISHNVTVEVTDGGGLTYSEVMTVNVIDLNEIPVIAFGEGNKSYTENAPRVVIDSLISVADPDLVDFDSGTLAVSFTANGTADDRLAIQNEGTGVGQVGQSGFDITYNFGRGPVIVGTVSGGASGSDPLVITFNANSTAVAVEEVARQISYMALGNDPSTATRTLEFVLTDGDGGTSTAVSKDISVVAVNDEQTLDVNIVLTLDEGGLGTITTAELCTSDPDNTVAQIVYTLDSTPAHGILYRNGVPLSADEKARGVEVAADPDRDDASADDDTDRTVDELFERRSTDQSG